MTEKERLTKITELLKRDYPEVETPLLHNSAFQLLVATRLSAQTLDATVNKATPKLFSRFKSVEDFATTSWEEVDHFISFINYHTTKAKNVVAMAQEILKRYDGKIPSTIEELTTLPGIGRKTANVVISEWFAKHEGILPEGFVVDTHVIRVANRLGLTKHKDPVKIEQDMMKLFPQEEWNDMSLRMIFHGRYRCKARDNQCCLDVEWKELCNAC